MLTAFNLQAPKAAPRTKPGKRPPHVQRSAYTYFVLFMSTSKIRISILGCHSRDEAEMCAKREQNVD